MVRICVAPHSPCIWANIAFIRPFVILNYRHMLNTTAVAESTSSGTVVASKKPSSGLSPWLWTGGVVLGVGGSIATTNYVCEDFQLVCSNADPSKFDADSNFGPFIGINYGLLGFSAFSAYKMQQAFRTDKSSDK